MNNLRIEISSALHDLKFHTEAGQSYQHAMGVVGHLFMRAGRAFLCRQTEFCTWCGRAPGWSSTMSRYGKRCDSCQGHMQVF